MRNFGYKFTKTRFLGSNVFQPIKKTLASRKKVKIYSKLNIKNLEDNIKQNEKGALKRFEKIIDTILYQLICYF